METTFDYSKLKGKIREIFDTQKNFCRELNISEFSLYKKLTNKVSFKQIEIINASKLLNIDATEIPIYFFTEKVEKTQR